MTTPRLVSTEGLYVSALNEIEYKERIEEVKIQVERDKNLWKLFKMQEKWRGDLMTQDRRWRQLIKG